MPADIAAPVELKPHATLAGQRVLCVLSPANWDKLVEVEDQLGRVFPQLKVVAPSDLDRMEEEIRTSAGQADVVITMGGDGTLHRALQWIDLDTQVLGLLPGGTGNDLARTLGYPLDLHGRIAHLAGLQPRSMDLGVLNGTRFHTCAGVGLDVASLRVREAPHGLFRRNYNLAFAVALLGMHPMAALIEADGRRHAGDYWWVLAMNNRDIGKGTRIAPKALIDDGLLDLVLIRAMPKLELLRMLPKATKGEHVGHHGVVYEQAAEIKVELESEPGWYACDGELYECDSTELRFSVVPNGLRMLR